LDDFKRQLKSGLSHFRYWANQDLNNANIYEKKDRENIKRYMAKISTHNRKDYKKFYESYVGTCRERVVFLYNQIMDPSICNLFSEKQRKRIHSWFIKQLPQPDVIKDINGDDSSLVENIEDKKNVVPLTDYYKDKYKRELDQEKLAEFMEYISKYLYCNLPGTKGNGILKISSYKKNNLFSKFCTLAEIAEDKEIKKLFFDDFNITEHIETIREQLGVPLEAISRYNSEHRNEIEHIGGIFDLKGKNKEKVLALLYMLSDGEEDNAIQRYREETGLNDEKYNSAN
jgi:hypothetical protein